MGLSKCLHCIRTTPQDSKLCSNCSASNEHCKLVRAYAPEFDQYGARGRLALYQTVDKVNHFGEHDDQKKSKTLDIQLDLALEAVTLASRSNRSVERAELETLDDSHYGAALQHFENHYSAIIL